MERSQKQNVLQSNAHTCVLWSVTNTLPVHPIRILQLLIRGFILRIILYPALIIISCELMGLLWAALQVQVRVYYCLYHSHTFLWKVFPPSPLSHPFFSPHLSIHPLFLLCSSVSHVLKPTLAWTRCVIGNFRASPAPPLKWQPHSFQQPGLSPMITSICI